MKKVTIKTPLGGFDEAWSGTYHAGDQQPFPEEATLKDGQEWGHEHSEVERVIKENANKKFGAALVSTDSSTLMVTVRFFKDEADMELWQQDSILYKDLVLREVSWQGSQPPSGYTLAVSVTAAPATTQIGGVENNFTFAYNSYWGGDTTDLDTQPGSAVLTVNGEVKERLSLASGGSTYSFNVGKYILKGNNSVSITISNQHDKSRTWNYTIEALTLGVEFGAAYLNQQSVSKGSNWELPINVSGVGGTVYVKVDSYNPQSRVVAGNSSATFNIDAQDTLLAGAHNIEVWAVDETYGLTSDHIKTQFIKAGSSAVVAIGSNPATEVTMYDTVRIPYFFFVPSADAGDVVLVTVVLQDANDNVITTAQQNVTVDSNHSSGMQNAVVNVMDNSYIGQTLTLVISITGAQATHDMSILAADVTLQEAAECKVYYNFGSKTNSDADVVANQMESRYNGQHTSYMRMSQNFKLNNTNGFHNGGCIVGPNKTLTLEDWQPFATDVGANGTQTGKTVEFEIASGIAADVDVPIVSCMDARCGFEVYPNRFEVKHANSNQRIITYFPDEERVRCGLVINGTTTECVNDDGNGNREVSYRNLAFIYMNGVIVRIFEYGTASWQQLTVKNIVFGSTESLHTLYTFRGYDKALKMKEMIDNYAYDTPLLADKIAIARRNNILLGDGETIDPLKVPAALPNTPRITWWMERLPSNKKDPQVCTETEFVNPEWNETEDGKVRAPFTAGEHEINGDGTSSNAYPLPYKNWAEKFTSGFTLHLISGDEHVSKYSITYGVSAGEKKEVHKVNFASSEGIFNILAMNMYQQLTLACKDQIDDLLSVQQQAQEDAGNDVTFRKSLSGFPEIGFRKHTVDGSPVTEFLSIYNFINNKKTGSMFGMTDDYTVNQLWEVDENRNFFNTPMTEHTVVDGQVVESNGVRDEEPMYYSRFPDESPETGLDLGMCEQVSQVAQANKEISALRHIHNWLVSVNPNVAKRYYARYGEYRPLTIAEDGWSSKTYGDVTFTTDTPQYRAQKFIDEVRSHLHLEDCIFYFLFCTWILGKDSMDKNMSLFLDILVDFYSDDPEVAAAAEVKLRIMLRDTDTTNMFDNTGILLYKYWHEWNDTYNENTGETGQITGESWDGSKYVVESSVAGASPVFNGRLSGLWDAISQFVPAQVRTIYHTMRSAGLNYQTFFAMYQHFRNYWCEALYNVDGMGYANTGNLNMAYGDKLLLSKYFYKYRERYMDSKYGYVNNAYRVTMRFNEVPTGVWMKHSTPLYASFSYGSGTPVTARSIVPGTAALLPCSSESLQDAVCYINDADYVTDLGFYSEFYGTTVYYGLEGIRNFHFTQNMGRLVRLKRFIWANTSARPNTEQTTQNGTVDFSNMKMLRELVMTYCTGWNGQPIIGSEIIEKIDFRGTPITQITIPETETLTELQLPETMHTLSLHNMTGIETFSIAGVASLEEVYVENTPLVVNTVATAIIDMVDSGGTSALQRGHLTLDTMNNDDFCGIVRVFGMEVFDPDNDLYFEAPDGVYLYAPRTLLEGGDTMTLQALLLPIDEGTTYTYQLIENDAVVTPDENGIATSAAGSTLDTATGLLTTVSGTAETLTVRAAATQDGTTAYSEDVAITVAVYTYPSSISIGGNYDIREDGNSTYARSFNTNNFTVQVVSTQWTLTDAIGVAAITSQSATQAIVTASGVSSTMIRATIAVTVTFNTGRKLSASRTIEIQNMVLRAVQMFNDPTKPKWANMNLGAATPEQYGLYYQWGDTVGYHTATAMNEALGRTDGFTQAAYNAQGLNAITASIPQGGTYDAAAHHEDFGAPWKMPTSAQFKELNDVCTSIWTTSRGVAGRLFTSKETGNSIFFPAAGYWNGTSLNFLGSYGYYWSSTFDNASNAYYLYFNSGNVNPQNSSDRWYGFPVRAVQ